MLALTVVFIIVLLAVFGYFTNELNKSRSETVYQMDMLSACYDDLSAWRDYALALETNYSAVRFELNRIAPYAMDSLIKMGKISATKLTYTDHTDQTGKQHIDNIYALSLPGFDMPVSDYAPKFDSDGAIIYAPIPVATPVADTTDSSTKSSNGNGNKNKSSKNGNGNNAKSSNNEPDNFTDTANLLKSDKYGDYLELLCKNLNAKSIPSDKYQYCKDMFIKWETGSKPNTAKEYAKRVIDNKYGNK